MDQMTVDIKQACAVVSLMNQVIVPDFVIQGAWASHENPQSFKSVQNLRQTSETGRICHPEMVCCITIQKMDDFAPASWFADSRHVKPKCRILTHQRP
jgi:hypothetical protein